MDKYVDTLIQVYVRDKEILSVSIKISDEIVYENVYLKKAKAIRLQLMWEKQDVCLM